MIPCPRLPVFIPSFLGSGRLSLRGWDLVDGVDPGVVFGLVAKSRGGETVLHRGGSTDAGIAGDIMWPDPAKYDEAVLLLDSRFEAAAERTKCQAFDGRAGCVIDCWVYLCREAWLGGRVGCALASMKTLIAIIAGVAIASPLSLQAGEGCCGSKGKDKTEQVEGSDEQS
jgi:hypothetical protein